MKKLSILIVEDSEDDALLVVRVLQKGGYDPAYERVETRDAMGEALERETWDIIISDYTMPHFSGLAALKLYKEKGLDIPFIIVSGTIGEEAAVAAMISGAHDYVMKKNLTRLVPAIQRELGEAESRRKRKRAEEALLNEKERFLSLVDNAPFGMIMVEQDGNFQYFNSKFEEWFGYTLYDSPNSKTWFQKAYPDPAYRHSVISTWKTDIEKLKAGEQIKNTFEVTCKDGSIKIVDFIPVQMESGQFLVACNDITSRIKAEKALTQSMDKLARAMSGIVDVIAMAVESRDPYTAGHQRRVANLAASIATEMGLTADQIDGIRMVGTIHDLGKISIPAEILSMPRKLTGIEFNLIKTHPKVGFDILKDIEFPWPIAQITLQHHERIDGSGYPLGLKGEEILIESRVLAVADVVEAIASHRPYRPALGIDKALEEIVQNKGILYDADVVETCVRLFREKGFSFE